jgi:hypothetical protein
MQAVLGLAAHLHLAADREAHFAERAPECGTAPTLEQAVADGDRARGEVTR